MYNEIKLLTQKRTLIKTQIDELVTEINELASIHKANPDSRVEELVIYYNGIKDDRIILLSNIDLALLILNQAISKAKRINEEAERVLSEEYKKIRNIIGNSVSELSGLT